MRILALFIIVGGILALSIWAVKLNPSRMEYSFGRPNFTHDQLDKIRYSTDLEELKEIAKNQLYTLDERVIERDQAAGTVGFLLAVILVLAFIAQIVMFFEIAHQGKNYHQEKP